jgi:hypothetical protein
VSASGHGLFSVALSMTKIFSGFENVMLTLQIL